jgi:predicted nucleic-acid-binding Zn-ribbon protein
MFFLMFSTSHQETEGPTVTMDCPSCGRRGPAESKEVFEQGTLFLLIPSFRHRTTWLTCRNCGKTFYVNRSLEELSGLHPAELGGMLYDNPSYWGPTILVLIALACSVIPFVGLLVAFLTQPWIWKSPGWQRILSWVALIISFISTSLFYII